MTEEKTLKDLLNEASTGLRDRLTELNAPKVETPATEVVPPVASDEPTVTTTVTTDESKTGQDASKPNAETPETAVAGADVWDEEKSWAKYPDEAARKKALAESQKTIIKTNEENRSLRERLAAIEAQKPGAAVVEDKPTDSPTPSEEGRPAADLKSWLNEIKNATPEKLDDTGRAVKTRLTELSQERKTLNEKKTLVNTHAEKETKIEAELKRLSDIAAEYEAETKENPGDISAEDRLTKIRGKINSSREELRDVRQSRIAARQDVTDLESRHISNVADFERRASGTLDQIQTIHSRQTEEKTETEKAQSEWKEALDDVSKSFTPAQSKLIDLGLQARLNLHLQGGTKMPADFKAWMKDQKDVFDGISEVKADAVKEVAATIASHAPKAPTQTTVTPKSPADHKEKPLNSVLGDARASLKRLLIK